MHADPQAWRGPRSRHAPCERGTVGQQRSTGHNSVMEGLDDSAVYAVRPSQVIRIDDQILHNLSLPLAFSCPLGQLLFCVPDCIRTIDPIRTQLYHGELEPNMPVTFR